MNVNLMGAWRGSGELLIKSSNFYGPYKLGISL